MTARVLASAGMQRPLDGIRVLDLSRVVAGPHAGRMMADLGADVIKLEPPVGDITRFGHPRVGSMPTYFTQQNVGKRNVSIDMSTPAGRELTARLADHCDVFVENFRPDVMPRMGLGYDDLAARNPRLVYLSINGYGSTGPWVKRRAYAPVVGAEIGLTKRQGDDRGGVYGNDAQSHADVYTALEGTVAVLSALLQRHVTGCGQRVEVTLAQTLLYTFEHLHSDLFDGEVDPEQVRSFGNAEYPVFELADGERAVVSGHPAAKGTFEGYARALGRTDLLTDARFATVSKRKERLGELLVELHDAASKVADAEVLEAIMEPYEMAVGRLRSYREATETDWARETGAVVEVPDRSGGSIRLANVPWKFGDADVEVRGEPRWRGEDNRSVLHELLGLDDAAIDGLEADGVLSARVPSSG